MKKVNKLFSTLLVCLLATSLSAVKVEVMPTVGKAFNANKDSLRDNETLYGIRGAVFLNEDVALQAAIETSTDNKMQDGGKTDIERGSLNVIYEKESDKRIRPYGVVGIGGEKVHRANIPPTNDDSQIFVNVGAGLKFGLNEHVDLVTEARWFKKLENNDVDVIATVGLGVKLGESKKKDDHIPSVTATTEAENAISLAKFREIYEKKPIVHTQKAEVVEVAVAQPVQPVIVEEKIISEPTVVIEEEIINEPDVIIEEEVSQSPVAEDGYYVQMAALFKGNGEVLTDRLEQKDYPYLLQDVTRYGKDAKLILVGPYATRQEANIAIKYLKRLKKDAFIYHMN